MLRGIYIDLPLQLLQDAVTGSVLPVWLTNSINYNKSVPLVNQTIQWGPLASGWDSVALLVDDVERYVGTASNYSLAGLNLNATIPHFFRLAVSKIYRITPFRSYWPFGHHSIEYIDELVISRKQPRCGPTELG